MGGGLASSQTGQASNLTSACSTKLQIYVVQRQLRSSFQAFEACQKDAHEAKEQAKTAEAERQLAEQKWEDAERKLKELQGDFDVFCRTPGTPLLRSYGELDQLSLSKLHSIQSQLRNDLDLIDGVRKSRSQTAFHFVASE